MLLKRVPDTSPHSWNTWALWTTMSTGILSGLRARLSLTASVFFCAYKLRPRRRYFKKSPALL